MIIENKKAGFDFEVLDTLEVGIELSGAEAKSFFENRVILNGSFVRNLGEELYLVNAQFTLASVPANTQKRSKRLLAHRKEILNWSNKMKEKKLTMVALSMYTRGRFIKLKIALVKSRAEHDKRGKLRQHDLEREAARDYRAKLD